MDILRLMISCLTGIGALALGTTVVVVLYVVRVMQRHEHKKPQDMPMAWDKYTEPLAVDWEAELAEAIERAQRDAW